MKRIHLFLAILCVLGLPTNLSAEKSSSILLRYETIDNAIREELHGTIGDYPIEVMLKHYDHAGSEGDQTWKVVGKYRYICNGHPGNWLGLTGEGVHVAGLPSSVSLSEFNASGKLTGEWELNSGYSMLTDDLPPCTFANPTTGRVSTIVLDDSNYN